MASPSVNERSTTHLTLNIKPSRIDPLLRPINAFLAAKSAGGILLLIATVIALVWANSPLGDTYQRVWHSTLRVEAFGFSQAMSLEQCVNDGLMVIFFLLVGLEIKREILIGELASLRQGSLPIAAAIGGMVVPALIFAAFNARGPGAAGWGVPMATDIAFAVGVLALAGRSVPTSIKVLLLAIAIVDDLGAVLVIALFYTSQISASALAIAACFLAALALLNVARVHRPLPYIVLGIGLWVATLYSGVHATIAGVLLAFTIPATRQVEEADYVVYATRMLSRFSEDANAVPDKITHDQSHALMALEEASQAVQTPLARVEHALLAPVSFLIVPLFALVNAGVDVRNGLVHAAESPISWGVLLGLLLGKPIGIGLVSWIALKSRFAAMPTGATWRHLGGVAVLCGMGFTMSLFVANLAFADSDDLLSQTKVAVLLASLLSGLVGGAIIAFSPRATAQTLSDSRDYRQ